MNKFTPLSASISAVLLSLVVSTTKAQTPSTAIPAQIRDDLAVRNLDIHWPQGYVPETAQLFAHNETAVNASCAAVWTHLIDAPAWPKWYQNSKDVRVAQGASLAKDSHFSWSTFDLPIQSSIFEFEPGRRLAWFGHGPDMHAYHTWHLKDAAAGCLVVTEEVTNGPAAAIWRAKDPAALHIGHDAWLAGLKNVVEAR